MVIFYLENMEKILFICHLTDSKCNGQVAKTTDTINFLKEKGLDVDILNYGKMNSLQKLFKSKKIIKRYNKVILMPGGKNALFFYINLIHKYKYIQAHYVAVGGWVLGLLSNSKYDRFFNKLKFFKGIYLQNIKTYDEFINKGFNNCYYVSNYSSKKPLDFFDLKQKESIYKTGSSYKFCFFARVTEEKGVFLACDAINKLSEKYNVSLDIYGEIVDEDINNRLEEVSIKNNKIKYCGILTGDDTINTLATYYCMLFPTFYKGEGTPHSIIESFMAGLPVIASNWAYNPEIVENNKYGLIFNLNETNDLTNKIEYAINNGQTILEIAKNCYNKSKDYNPDKLLIPLLNNLK